MDLRANSRDQLPQAANHVRGRLGPVRWSNEQVDRPEPMLLEAERLANASLDVVALRGRCGVLFRHQQSQPRRSAWAPLDVEGVAVDVAARPLAKQVLELRAPPQAAPRIQAEALGRG